jgi:hypothetical protein
MPVGKLSLGLVDKYDSHHKNVFQKLFEDGGKHSAFIDQRYRMAVFFNHFWRLFAVRAGASPPVIVWQWTGFTGLRAPDHLGVIYRNNSANGRRFTGMTEGAWSLIGARCKLTGVQGKHSPA